MPKSSGAIDPHDYKQNNCINQCWQCGTRNWTISSLYPKYLTGCHHSWLGAYHNFDIAVWHCSSVVGKGPFSKVFFTSCVVAPAGCHASSLLPLAWEPLGGTTKTGAYWLAWTWIKSFLSTPDWVTYLGLEAPMVSKHMFSGYLIQLCIGVVFDSPPI